MFIRQYRPGEEEELWRLLYETVREVNIRDYTPAQVAAWAPNDRCPDDWSTRISRVRPYVCFAENQIVGFADVQETGYVNFFYVHHLWQRRGVGRLLMAHIHEIAVESGLTQLFSNVSITALPFFAAHGFATVTEQQVEVRGVWFTNYRMVKILST